MGHSYYVSNLGNWWLYSSLADGQFIFFYIFLYIVKMNLKEIKGGQSIYCDVDHHQHHYDDLEMMDNSKFQKLSMCAYGINGTKYESAPLAYHVPFISTC